MRTLRFAQVVALLCCVVAAQTPQLSASPGYWLKQLELPARRELAMERLLEFGPKVVESLASRLEDPRPEIQILVVRTLGLLGKDGEPALAKISALDTGKDDTLALAVESAVDAIRGGRGMLLVFDFVDGKLVEMDGRGKERRALDGLPQLRAGRRLASGNYLVATRDGVRELTPAGVVVWSLKDVVVHDVERLVGGRTLIASADSHRVFEVDAAGKVVWTYIDEGREFRPVSCQRLLDGNTLIADYPVDDLTAGRVIEVDRRGQIVWQIRWKQAAQARRLAGGRTLIVSHKPGRVQVVDKAGKVLQLFQDVGIPTVASYLPNGHLLVGGEGFLRELDAKGVRLWNQSMRWVSGIQRH